MLNIKKSKLVFATLAIVFSFFIQKQFAPITTVLSYVAIKPISVIKPVNYPVFKKVKVYNFSVYNNCDQYLNLFEKYNWNLNDVLRICQAESGGNAMATGYNANGSIDRGILQVNSIHADLVGYNLNALYTPSVNVAVAYQIYQAHSWCAWTTSFSLGLCYN